MSATTRCAELGITLPPVAAPVADYVPAIQTGSQILTSGQLPFVDGELTAVGKVGDAVSAEQAAEAARAAALNAIAAVATWPVGWTPLSGLSEWSSSSTRPRTSPVKLG